jgi:hypothetical protein
MAIGRGLGRPAGRVGVTKLPVDLEDPLLPRRLWSPRDRPKSCRVTVRCRFTARRFMRGVPPGRRNTVRRATGLLSLREHTSEPQLRLQRASEKHSLTRWCARLLFLRPRLSNPRTRSPLPGGRRFWHFIRDIRVVRCRTGSPSACRRCLGFLNRVYRLRWCCR